MAGYKWKAHPGPCAFIYKAYKHVICWKKEWKAQRNIAYFHLVGYNVSKHQENWGENSKLEIPVLMQGPSMGGAGQVIVAKYKTRDHWFKKIYPAHKQLLAVLS